MAQKLELTWIGKDERPRLEPRILLEDPARSYHAKQRVTANDLFDNRLIKGDNLLALKALEAEFAGKVKCVFIDPPYNTGSAFTHYDDGLEHSIWLGLMRDRLEIIRRLLSEDGSLWITIDDNEAHYLKVLCDEVFGRSNFVANCLWQKVYSERMDARGFSVSHDHLLVYRARDEFKPKQLFKEQNSAQFGFFDEKAQKYYRRRSLRKEGSESLRQDRPSMWYEIEAPDRSKVLPIKPDGTEGRWRWKKDNVTEKADELEFVQKDGRWEIYVKQYIEVDASRPPATFWPSEEVGHNHEAKLEVRAFNSANVFDTPKPERLLKRVLEIATNPGDLVLDSFAGSGTTGAVAHKMGRRWIMVELGEHCHTHIVPRLQKVIDGQDPGGVTQATGWQGGGGFRYYELAPTLLATDRWGNLVINPAYDAAMLSAAMCKLEGFAYAPSEVLWWQHGHSSETDFIYVTTQTLSAEQLDALSNEVGADPRSPRSLLVCCGAYRGVTAAQAAERWPNLTIKKIPKMVRDRCEWGHDDYSLNVANLPMAQKKADAPAQDDLFGGDGGVSGHLLPGKTARPAVVGRVVDIVQAARTQAARSVNTTQVVANWLIGREIVLDEQAGRRRAGYGQALLKDMAERLKLEFGPGYGVDNLEMFRRFFLEYPRLLPQEISDAPRRKSAGTAEGLPVHHAARGDAWQAGLLSADLSWTHYRLLVRVDKVPARTFYEIEAIANSWSARELERQISSLLFERLALSKDKKGVMRLATRGHEVAQPADVFKDPVVMEFLGLPESPRLVESRLEQALIDNLQHFLLELGKGFAFVSRQERITLDGDHFYIDLVFYHTVLKCYVLIDLKTTKLTHQDLGQVQLYVNYYDMERRTEGDNPTLGLILCANKNDAVVKYTLGPDQARKIFASRYKLHLPTEEQLQAQLQREVRHLSPPTATTPPTQPAKTRKQVRSQP